MLRSRDCIRWEALGPVVELPAAAQGAECWAPAVAEHAGVFHCSYSLGDARIPQHQLRHAIARQPTGPYQDLSALIPGAVYPSPSMHIPSRTAMACGGCSMPVTSSIMITAATLAPGSCATA